jgi:RNA polymerase sigma-70 factor (ECF subfamily)
MLESASEGTGKLQEGILSLEYLFREYYARLCYFAYRFTDNHDLAEDLVQDCFLKFWDRRADVANETAAKAYLYQSVRNACLNALRHAEVERKYATSQQAGSGTDTPHRLEMIIRAELLGQVHQAIESLPEGCRQVLKLAYFESLKNEEIAEQLGVSVNTVKTQKARALKLLRFRLGDTAFLLFLMLSR